MEVKKSSQANLENRKFLFITMGVVFSLSLLLISLEWTQNLQKVKAMNVAAATTEDEIIAPTQRQEVQPPPPPPPPQITDQIMVVDDEIKLDDNLDFKSDVDQKSSFSNFTGPTGPAAPATEEVVDDNSAPFVIVETMPKFNGNILAWVGKNLKYPAIAAENGIQGRVFIQFVIEKDGSVSNVKVSRGVDPSLDKEAIRVVQSMPKWTPGEQRGKKVRVSYSMPISFVLK